MNAICLVVDRLHLGYLGAYGNTWIETPQFDRLASQGFLFDQFVIDSPHLEFLCRSYWQGVHALARAEAGQERAPLPSLLGVRGVTTALVTDEPAVADHPLASAFDRRLEIDALPVTEPAPTMEETHLARCFAEMIEWLRDAPEPFFLWCHLMGLGAAWDAPLERRRAYADEDDPPPPESVTVPNRLLEPDCDPDEVLGISQAYAGQVSLLDTCLGALAKALEASRAGRETLLVLVGARGFPLGEHRRVGACDNALYGELVRAPLVMGFPGRLGAAARSQALVEPADLWATILDWFEVADAPASLTGRSLLPVVRGDLEALRDRLCIMGHDASRAGLTPFWYLRKTDALELFVHPDDFWQVNNVSDRCPEVAGMMEAMISQYFQAVQSNQSPYSSPLPETLRVEAD